MAAFSHSSYCITPAMTADNAPTPVVITESGYTPGSSGWYAFNHVSGAPWYYNDPYNPQWLDVDLGLGNSSAITSYTLTSADNNASYPGMPVTWVLKGSNVDNAWITADVLDTQTSVAGWGNAEMRTYALSVESAAYRYFRIEMSVKESGGFGWQVAEIELIHYTTPTSPAIFTESGIFQVPDGVTSVDVLVVAGGGGGGGHADQDKGGGGGGAGGLIYESSFAVTPAANITVTVGAGGGGGDASGSRGINGSNSVFDSLVAIGGGGGAGGSGGSGGTAHTGKDGGSGGGATRGGSGGVATSGQGYDGGSAGSVDGGSGGGGAGSVGAAATGAAGAAGGTGVTLSLSGASVDYAGGGGGGAYSGSGGSASFGGGTGGDANADGSDGTVNTGGGGGGAGGGANAGRYGKNGGSGVVIIVWSSGVAPDPPTDVAATETLHDKVTVTWTKSTGATGYKIYRDSTLIDTVGDVATYDDTGAAAPVITPGSSIASDGTYTDKVALSLSSQSVANGTTHVYKLKAVGSGGDSSFSSTTNGFRLAASLTYQWQRSAADSDASYSDISSATTASYDDTGAPSDGSGRYFKCKINATGSTQQISSSDRGYRNALVFVGEFYVYRKLLTGE